MTILARVSVSGMVATLTDSPNLSRSCGLNSPCVPQCKGWYSGCLPHTGKCSRAPRRRCNVSLILLVIEAEEAEYNICLECILLMSSIYMLSSTYYSPHPR